MTVQSAWSICHRNLQTNVATGCPALAREPIRQPRDWGAVPIAQPITWVPCFIPRLFLQHFDEPLHQQVSRISRKWSPNSAPRFPVSLSTFVSHMFTHGSNRNIQTCLTSSTRKGDSVGGRGTCAESGLLGC